MATKVPSSSELSGYVLEILQVGPALNLCRGRQRSNPSPVLAVTPTAEQPSRQSLQRLEYEYCLGAGLDSAWAAKPRLIRRKGRTILVVNDSGG